MKRALVIAIVFLCVPAAFADVGFQFNTIDVQAPEDPVVSGMRLNLLYGKNEKVSGFDLGLASYSDAVTQSGLTLNMGLSRVTGTSSGCGCSLINIHEGADSGLNIAFINVLQDAEKAVNIGFVNVTETNTNVEISGITVAKKSKIQIGFVNVAKEIKFVQIGFLNIAENGFLPIFPFFNFPKN